MNHSILIALMCSVLIVFVNGHGRLMEPVNRGSAWRQYPNDFPEATYDIEWCGYDSKEKEEQYLKVNPTDIRNVTCGKNLHSNI